MQFKRIVDLFVEKASSSNHYATSLPNDVVWEEQQKCCNQLLRLARRKEVMLWMKKIQEKYMMLVKNPITTYLITI
jgi:hypothetical protein